MNLFGYYLKSFDSKVSLSLLQFFEGRYDRETIHFSPYNKALFGLILFLIVAPLHHKLPDMQTSTGKVQQWTKTKIV